MNDQLRTAVLLSLQRALWERVTPDLRGVAVTFSGELDHGARVEARFMYEGPVGPLELECVSLAETYFLADFLADMSASFVAIEHATLDLQDSENWAYLRWEPLPQHADVLRPGAE